MKYRAPSTDRPRPQQKSRLLPRLLSFVSIGSVTLAPVAALTIWLLISDAATAAAVMERGDLLPVISALAKLIGKAFAAVLAIL
jgi:hypothetical protein